MSELILSATTVSELSLDSGVTSGTNDHAKLKNLNFKSSGHTGFQEELSAEQIKAISKVGDKVDKEEGKGLSANDFTDMDKKKLTELPVAEDLAKILEGKEDFANKKTTMLDGITDDTTYPTTNAVRGFVYNTIEQELQSYANQMEPETIQHKVTSLSENSTDEQYPSAKCVYGLIGDVETTLAGHADIISILGQGQAGCDTAIAELKEDMGDVETALDNIITIQNTLVGGDSE